MAPKFGTSGLRGLVVELTPELVAAHVAAFAASCPTGGKLFVGRDLRPSSPRIAGDVIDAARALGLDVTDCGEVPTPALAMASMAAGAAAVMVTGSHIPADRNGLKFYVPEGEISKAHEGAILAALGTSPSAAAAGALVQLDAGPAYVSRYVQAFGEDALKGQRIGVYAHSAVGRDLIVAVLEALGADTVELARSDSFIPVDTEAVEPEVREMLRSWAVDGFHAIVSTDGDGDRPLVADETGKVVPGDILGQITAAVLGARTVVTPVSSNTGVNGQFASVLRTRIGSPFVIAGMEGQPEAVGYEANGGFLLGFSASGPAGALPPLMTRDSLLPIIAPLWRASRNGLAALVAAEPARFTAADRLTGIEVERSAAFLAGLDADGRKALLADLGAGAETGLDRTDGLRILCHGGRVVHLRPSGNAPEFRLYVEAEDEDAAQQMLAAGLKALSARLT